MEIDFVFYGTSHASDDQANFDLVEWRNRDKERETRLIKAGASYEIMRRLFGMDTRLFAAYRKEFGLTNEGVGRPRHPDRNTVEAILGAWSNTADMTHMADRLLKVHDALHPVSMRHIWAVVSGLKSSPASDMLVGRDTNARPDPIPLEATMTNQDTDTTTPATVPITGYGDRGAMMLAARFISDRMDRFEPWMHAKGFKTSFFQRWIKVQRQSAGRVLQTPAAITIRRVMVRVSGLFLGIRAPFCVEVDKHGPNF